jgi:hypothetical protein
MKYMENLKKMIDTIDGEKEEQRLRELLGTDKYTEYKFLDRNLVATRDHWRRTNDIYKNMDQLHAEVRDVLKGPFSQNDYHIRDLAKALGKLVEDAGDWSSAWEEDLRNAEEALADFVDANERILD